MTRNLVTLYLLPTLLVGCSTSQVRVPVQDNSSCTLIPADEHEGIRTIAVAGGVEERVLFRVTHNSLVEVNCAGKVEAGLATSWKPDDGGQLWTFLLPKDRKEAASAHDLAPQWRDVTARYAQLDSLKADGDEGLVMYFNEPFDQPPLFLASPDFALPAPSTLNIVDTIGKDERDLLDEEIDILITHNPEAIDYARSQPEWEITALPWDRVYALAMNEFNHAISQKLPVSWLEELAQNAVRSEARAFDSPMWWDDLGTCETLDSRTLGSKPGAEAILTYNRNDQTARELAERIVALTSGASRSGEESALNQLFGAKKLKASGLIDSPLAQSLETGSSAAYILSMDRTPYDVCSAAGALLDGAPWLAGSWHRIVPLVETRPHVIARKGIGVLVDGFGHVVLDQ